MRCCVVGLLIWTWPVLALGSDTSIGEIERLPEPQLDGGRPLMAVLRDPQEHARVQSAACQPPTTGEPVVGGLRRKPIGDRPSDRTIHDEFVLCGHLYRDNRRRLSLRCRCPSTDLDQPKRCSCADGRSGLRKDRAAGVVYVADHVKFAKVAPEERVFYAAADTGLIGQNVYLYCASEGLGFVIHMPGDRAGISRRWSCEPEQKIVLV